MEDKEFRKTYYDVSNIACPFQKSILTQRCDCEKVNRFNLAEREGVGCTDATAKPTCDHLLHLIKLNSRFALKMTAIAGPLAHAQAMKVQAGGLSGLQAITYEEEEGRNVENVFGLIEDAREKFGAVDDFPYSRIMSYISQYEGRKSRGKRRNRK